MSDVFDFRIARAPQRTTPSGAVALYKPRTIALPSDTTHVPMVTTPSGGVGTLTPVSGTTLIDQLVASRSPKRVASGYVGSDQYVGPGAALPPPLRDLDAWLVSKANRAAPAEIETFLGQSAAAIVQAAGWLPIRQRLADSMVAALVTVAAPEVFTELTRLVIVAALLDDMAANPSPIKTADDVYAKLRWTLLVMPPQLLTIVESKARLARRYGFSEYIVVREDWKEYAKGEIAHIENALAGEFRERSDTLTTSTTATSSTETTTSTSEEHDLQTTDRNELSQHASDDVSLSAHVDGKVDVSAQYGPASIQSHVGGSLDYSKSQANDQATTMAHETIARAVKKVEDTVKTSRSVTQSERYRETNIHRLDNTKAGAGNIIAVYRWVDKIQRLQMFHYPHRMLLEFEVPDPASFVLWRRSQPQSDFLNPEPLPLVALDSSGAPIVDVNGKTRLLRVTDITETNYLHYVARYGIPEIATAPAPQIVKSMAFEMRQQAGTQSGTGYEIATTDTTFVDLVAGSDGQQSGSGVDLPQGYRMSSWIVEIQTYASHPSKLTDGTDVTITTGDRNPQFWVAVGINAVKAALDTNVSPTPSAGLIFRASYAPPAGTTWPDYTDAVPVTVTAVLTREFRGHLQLICDRLPSTLVAWQLAAFDKIVATYKSLASAHQQEVTQRQTATASYFTGASPERNAEIVREELKRAVVRLVSSGGFPPDSSLTPTSDDQVGPVLDLDQAALAGPEIQFIEQAFEWENLSFVLYPYYWSTANAWKDLAEIDGPDPDFARFLRSGSARVVVPARPGFEDQVRMYVDFGVMWGGGPVPAVGDPDYLSIAAEIKAQTSVPDDGTPGEWWDEKLPTTLFVIDGQAQFPIDNPNLTLGPPPAH